MERELKNQPPAAAITLAPGTDAGSWVVIPDEPGIEPERYPSLAEAAQAIVGRGSCTLCLPCDAFILHRATLPAVDPSELKEMSNLQLERVLPYALDAAESSLDVVEMRAESADVVSSVAPLEHLLQIARPLEARARWPARVATNAQRAASRAGTNGSALAIFEENGQPVAVASENGLATFVQPLTGRSVEDLTAELPSLLLGAELAGVKQPFGHALLEERWKLLGPALAEAAGCVVEIVDFERVPCGAAGADLQPAQWRAQKETVARRRQLAQLIMLAAACYVALIALGWVYAGFLRYQLAVLDGKTAKRAPRVLDVSSTIRKWNALAPAIDRRLYLLEVLYNVCESIPATDLRVTSYEQSPLQILMQGEAPSAAMAYDLNERLKSRPEMKDLKFTAEPPQILANGRARFRISISFSS